MNEFISKISLEKIKPLAIAAICFISVFIAGFGTGRLSPTNSASNTTKRSLNYTTNSNSEAKAPEAPKAASTNTATGECYIKGSKSKIYHVPGGSFYERTNADKCFATEEEAQAAGFTKSSR